VTEKFANEENMNSIPKEQSSKPRGEAGKAARLRELIVSKETTFLMEAHNALSA
jgi:hypothetical protein